MTPRHRPSHDWSRLSPAVRQSIIDHGLRLTWSGYEGDRSERVAELLGLPNPLVEAVLNRHVEILARQVRRYHNGIMNTLSQVKDAEREVWE